MGTMLALRNRTRHEYAEDEEVAAADVRFALQRLLPKRQWPFMHALGEPLFGMELQPWVDR